MKGTAKKEKLLADCREWEREVLQQVDRELKSHAGVALAGAKNTDTAAYLPLLISYLTGKAANGEERAGEQGVSCVLQENNLFETYSVIDNIYMNCPGYYGLRRKALAEECRQAFETFGIRIPLRKRIELLTNEEKKIVEVMRAYLMKPSIMIADDTMAQIGFPYSEVYTRIVGACRENGCRLVYLTTRWEDAIKVSERVIVLAGGRMEQVFDAEEVKKNPQKLVYWLSGGQYAHPPQEEENEYYEVISSILKGTEFLTNDFELGNTLEYLTETIQEVMNAQGCIVYLNNQDRIIEFSNQAARKNSAALKHDWLRERLSKQDSFDLLYVQLREETAAAILSAPSVAAQTLFGLPIVLKGRPLGFLEIWYDRYFVYTEKQLLIFSAFANEAATIVETARLMDRSLLLQESHHRIKNNLQIIVSLLYLQQTYSQNGAGHSEAAAVQATITRIKSIAAVHDILSKDAYGSSLVNIKDILRELLRFYETAQVKISLEMEDVFVIQKRATSIALVLNELLNNCFKHAFTGLPAEYERNIRIGGQIDNQQVRIVVQDNGVGMKEEGKEGESLGLFIVHTLVEKELKGQISWETGPGVKTTLLLPRSNIFSSYMV